jgi:hypothetical protein
MLILSLCHTAGSFPEGPMGQAAGYINHHTKSHVLSAKCVMSNSTLSLTLKSSSHQVWLKLWAKLGNGSGIPPNILLALKLAQVLVNTDMVRGHGLSAVPLLLGLSCLFKGQHT